MSKDLSALLTGATHAGAAGPVLIRSANAQEAATMAAQHIAQALQRALSERARATLVLSGGQSPVPMLEALAATPLPWECIDITLADERWVPDDHVDSNAGLVKKHLLQQHAAQAVWWPLYDGSATPQQAFAAIGQRLRQAMHWPADVVVLGMGGDGHTASWFPGQVLSSDGPWCMPVDVPPAPNVQQPRISLTPAALLNAVNLLVLGGGASKEAMLAQALLPPQDDPEPENMRLPIRRALWRSGLPCHVFWAA
jgi:6-phosphogluconolactonase